MFHTLQDPSQIKKIEAEFGEEMQLLRCCRSRIPPAACRLSGKDVHEPLRI